MGYSNEAEVIKKKEINYISGMFGLHASIVLIRYVTHFHSALAPGDGGASL